MKIGIAELMEISGVSFGTSGARGPVSSMSDLVCFAYTTAFLRYLEETGQLGIRSVAVGMDLRPSSERIATACIAAAQYYSPGIRAVWCGPISSPALALFGRTHAIPTVMVTGSHIPDDRNGLKFTTPAGEITKEDEKGIAAIDIAFDDSIFGTDGKLSSTIERGVVDSSARTEYLDRYRTFFGDKFLSGMRVAVYQHSAVIRDDLVTLVKMLGGEALPLGRSEKFIPVDTEAIRDEDHELARKWGAEHHFDVIISADGDSDRPLIGDSTGRWLRGDVAGIFCAMYLGASSVSTPISSNTALEKCSNFLRTRRTRIGSPYVIASMKQESATHFGIVVGYEANGGFLLGTDIERDGQVLKALPTRDAVIVHLGVIGLARREGASIEDLQVILPQRFTFSDRIKQVPISTSAKLLKELNPDDGPQSMKKLFEFFGDIAGKVSEIDTTDGLRVTFQSDEILHLRPSGNAPELRCYSEASTAERAAEINRSALEKVKARVSQI